jgi:pyruvate/2-oxoglutarate dehydrogenase complex dihydrolipoamide acyltransferase (E2) component
VLAEIETEKFIIEVHAPFAGTLTKRYARTGDIVQVGSDLYQLTPVAKSAAAAAKPARR